MRKRTLSWLCLFVAGSALGCKLLQLDLLPFPEAAATDGPPSTAGPGLSTPASPQAPLDGSLPPFDDGLAALRPAYQPDPARLPELQHATRYAILLQVDASGRYQGRQAVRLTNTETQPLERIYFRLLPNGGRSYGNGGMQAGPVYAASGAALPTSLSLENTALEVRLPQPLAVGHSLTVTLPFTGSVPHDFGGGYGIFNLSDDVLTLANAYPILAVYDQDGWNLDPVSAIGDSVYSDTAFYSVKLCLPPGWTAATSGVETAAGGACRLYASGPSRDFFIAASPRFQVLEQPLGQVSVRAFYLPDDKAGAQQALQVAAASLQTYQKRFGEYVFNQFDIVETPLRYASGVEYPGLVLILDELYHDSPKERFAMTVSHETAHQWWYSLVGNDVFDAPWLDEGLTTYSSLLYFEDTPAAGARPSDFLNYWRPRWEKLHANGQDQPVTKSLGYFEQLDQDSTYSTVVYLKSALFYDALRTHIGDQAFFAALQKFYTQERYRVASAQDLLPLFEQTSGQSLQTFYQTWLYEPARP